MPHCSALGCKFRDLEGVKVGARNHVEWDASMDKEKFGLSFVDGRSLKPFGRLWWNETVPPVVTQHSYTTRRFYDLHKTNEGGGSSGGVGLCISENDDNRYLGRMDYARALIDWRADRALKDTLVIYVPMLDGNGSMMHNVKVEYEWKPPRCGTCSVFGHDGVLCPKRAINERKAFRGPVTREQEVLGDLEDDRHLDAPNVEDPKRDSEGTHMEENLVENDMKNMNFMDDLLDDTRTKVGAPPKKTGIWLGRNADSSSELGFTSPSHFDLLTKEYGKSILRNLQESDDDVDVENGCDDTATPSKSLGNSPCGNT
ncbi:hypothetical protein Tco_1276416 [Tanacetum coccineum]